MQENFLLRKENLFFLSLWFVFVFYVSRRGCFLLFLIFKFSKKNEKQKKEKLLTKTKKKYQMNRNLLNCRNVEMHWR